MIEPLVLVLAVLRAAGGRAPSRAFVQEVLAACAARLPHLADSLRFSGGRSRRVEEALEECLRSGLAVEAEGGGLALAARGAAAAAWDMLEEEERATILAQTLLALERRAGWKKGGKGFRGGTRRRPSIC